MAAVDAEVDLSGLEVVDADAEFLEAAALQIRAQAEVHCLIAPFRSHVAAASTRHVADWCRTPGPSLPPPRAIEQYRLHTSAAIA